MNIEQEISNDEGKEKNLYSTFDKGGKIIC